MAITTLTGLRTALPGQTKTFMKANLTTAAGLWASLWGQGNEPAAGSLSIGNTTTGVIPTAATAGAFSFVNPASGNSYLAQAVANGSNVGTLVVYDRLWHAGSFTPASGTINATDSTPIDRGSNGGGAELWCEINSALSATAITLTALYTDQDGNTGNSATCAVPASAIAGRMMPFALASGDTGIRSVEDLSGSAAPTGSFNLVILRRLLEIPLAAPAIPNVAEWLDTALARIYDNACIAMMVMASSTSTGAISGKLNIAQG